MGKLFPKRVAHCTYNEVPRLLDSPRGVRDNAGIELISAADHPDHWNIQSPAADTSERQRSALENLLANVIPRDADIVSRALIDEFKTLNRIFGESKEALERVTGCNSEVAPLLHAAQNALIESLYCDVKLRLIAATDQRLIDYLVVSMASQSVERLRVLFLDRGNHLVGDEIMASGSLTTITAYPRTIFKRAFELSASAIILVHNHPGGGVEPSRCDIDFTRQIASLGKALEIDVRDHIIIAGTKWSSFRRFGLL